MNDSTYIPANSSRSGWVIVISNQFLDFSVCIKGSVEYVSSSGGCYKEGFSRNRNNRSKVYIIWREREPASERTSERENG